MPRKQAPTDFELANTLAKAITDALGVRTWNKITSTERASLADSCLRVARQALTAAAYRGSRAALDGPPSGRAAKIGAAAP